MVTFEEARQIVGQHSIDGTLPFGYEDDEYWGVLLDLPEPLRGPCSSIVHKETGEVLYCTAGSEAHKRLHSMTRRVGVFPEEWGEAEEDEEISEEIWESLREILAE